MGGCPCPRCAITKDMISGLGTQRDSTIRTDNTRHDNDERRDNVVDSSMTSTTLPPVNHCVRELLGMGFCAGWGLRGAGASSASAFRTIVGDELDEDVGVFVFNVF
ncbi:hypothetical protein DFH29DRAFT_517785 [Suillus ampliporus]|nr:hypothetical protein DFH29DRAFT_517785 [Suillus ampliporus]